jgi:hypothetical protein
MLGMPLLVRIFEARLYGDKNLEQCSEPLGKFFALICQIRQA